MTVSSRRVAAIPVRTSVETWNAIVGLLAAPDHDSQATLTAITGTAAMLIAEEYTRDSPLVVIPARGARIRVYTIHGQAAVDGDDEAGTPLVDWPTAEAGWRLSLPCGVDDIDEVRTALKPYPHIEVRDLTEEVTVEVAASAPQPGRRVSINYDELEQP